MPQYIQDEGQQTLLSQASHSPTSAKQKLQDVVKAIQADFALLDYLKKQKKLQNQQKR